MDYSKARDLIKKHLSGKSSEQEDAVLESWYIQATENAEAPLAVLDYDQIEKEILGRLRQNQQPVLKRPVWIRIASTAAAMLILGMMVFFIRNPQRKDDHPVYSHDFAPATGENILTLSDGRKIVLNDSANPEIAKESGVNISGGKDGHLIYRITENADSRDNQQNTLHTGNGQNYKIILQDGTTVWLNARSSLSYPVSFNAAGERIVKLSGEAYFEVHKNARSPFKVITETEEVRVLGTHFNLKAYPGQAVRQTTLLEGSIEVSNLGRPGLKKTLKPGQQLSSDNNLSVVTEVDADDAIAWKEGLFYFNDQRLDVIMQDISRWYNVPVVFSDESVKSILYSGTISRYSNVSQILSKIEQMGAVKFRISADKITVSEE
ncbi:putative anti-sigma factor [Pedobacter sp. BAL39]|uniref:FecR family protein n=1 Tax=Pedobacter sp. BAL39 TaxID=391596 RepID=UPI0001559C25|nr:FecR domain-containing protein [Pedobacter sp. BAL39]EDM35837.1 putative anti-sigma factor [Pedobacter sp. BAL39]